jgi:hypothetical protein
VLVAGVDSVHVQELALSEKVTLPLGESAVSEFAAVTEKVYASPTPALELSGTAVSVPVVESLATR